MDHFHSELIEILTPDLLYQVFDFLNYLMNGGLNLLVFEKQTYRNLLLLNLILSDQYLFPLIADSETMI